MELVHHQLYINMLKSISGACVYLVSEQGHLEMLNRVLTRMAERGIGVAKEKIELCYLGHMLVKDCLHPLKIRWKPS